MTAIAQPLALAIASQSAIAPAGAAEERRISDDAVREVRECIYCHRLVRRGDDATHPCFFDE